VVRVWSQRTLATSFSGWHERAHESRRMRAVCQNLTSLQDVDLDDNELTSMPLVLCSCTALTKLSIRNNKLQRYSRGNRLFDKAAISQAYWK
jgi:Leucine-rich repeat (LRR) protein